MCVGSVLVFLCESPPLGIFIKVIANTIVKMATNSPDHDFCGLISMFLAFKVVTYCSLFRISMIIAMQ